MLNTKATEMKKKQNVMLVAYLKAAFDTQLSKTNSGVTWYKTKHLEDENKLDSHKSFYSDLTKDVLQKSMKGFRFFWTEFI